MKFPDAPAGLSDLPTFARDIRNYLRSITLRPAAGYGVSRTANGTTILPIPQDGPPEPASFFRHPFRLSLVNTSTPTAAIDASSRLYKSISTTDTQGITNLATAFTLASNTYVWIEVTVSSLAVTAAERKTGTAWPSLVVTSGSPAAQTQFNIPVGRVVSSDATKPGFEFSISGTGYHFEQCLFSHLLIENRCNNGTPILYAFPWGGAA